MPTQADNATVRVSSIKVYDDGDMQKLEMSGRANERFGGTGGTYAVPRVQNYGFSNHPPKGSHGLTMGDGNPDKAMVIGMEDPKSRPKNLEEGEIKLYDKWGHYLHGKESEWHTKVGPCEIWYKESGEIKIKVGNAIILMKEDEGGTIHLNPPG